MEMVTIRVQGLLPKEGWRQPLLSKNEVVPPGRDKYYIWINSGFYFKMTLDQKLIRNGRVVMMAYTKKVGVKFDEKGNPLYFPGTTIICFTNDVKSDLYQELVWAQTELKKISFAFKYAALPPSSFHMTVLSLSDGKDRGTRLWPKMFQPDTTWHEVDLIQKGIVASIPKPDGFKMKITKCTDRRFALAPYDRETRQLLKNYRDLVSEKTGVRLDNHDTFVFHITLFYKLQQLEPEEQKELDRVLDRINQRVLHQIQFFITGKPQFTIFNDMDAYYEDLSRRTEGR
jgi:hypothetical protein